MFFILFVRLIKLLFKAFGELISKKYSPRIEKHELNNAPIKYVWIPAEVNTSLEHIELYYDEQEDQKNKELLRIAYIAFPKDSIFHVQFLIKADSIENTAALFAAQKELNFYLTKHPAPDPWSYAKHHCNTAANIYSHIHWSYIPPI